MGEMRNSYSGIFRTSSSLPSISLGHSLSSFAPDERERERDEGRGRDQRSDGNTKVERDERNVRH